MLNTVAIRPADKWTFFDEINAHREGHVRQLIVCYSIQSTDS
jgi:hypothetical protein